MGDNPSFSEHSKEMSSKVFARWDWDVQLKTKLPSHGYEIYEGQFDSIAKSQVFYLFSPNSFSPSFTTCIKISRRLTGTILLRISVIVVRVLEGL